MKPWKDQVWLIADTETTGIGPTDEIVELGALLVQRGELLDRRNVRLRPNIPIPESASEIHGIRDEHVKGCPALHEPNPKTGTSAADGLCKMAARAAVLVGYNILHFDQPLLVRSIPAWAEASAHMPIIDPLMLVRLPEVGKFWPGKGRHKLGAVAQRLGVDADHPKLRTKLHSAVWDCWQASEILRVLMDHLPDDADEAAARCVALAAEQEADFQAWLAKQPPLTEDGKP